MNRLYQPFLLFYGGIHILGGIVLWANPAAADRILFEPLPVYVGPLLGFASLLGGLGFAAAAGVTQPWDRKMAIVACGIANVLDFAAHFHNVVRGHSPTWVAVLAGVVVALFISVLVLIYRSIEDREA